MTHPRFDNKLLSQAMNIFLHFSQSQHLSKTAQHFGLSVSSVSRQISTLENELNLELVSRHHRPLILTKNGMMLAQSLGKKVNEIHDIVERIQGNSCLKPDLRIAFLESFVHFSVEFILRLRTDTHQIICLSGTTDRLKELLQQNIVDMIVTSDPWLEVKGLSRMRLLRESSVLLTPKCLERSVASKTWSWQQLTFCGLPYIRSYNQSASGKDVDNFRVINNIPLTSTLEVDSVRTKIALIGQGLGWTILPAMALYQNQDIVLDLLNHHIVISPMPAPSLKRDIYLLAQNSTNSSLLQKVNNELPNLLKSHVCPWFDNHFPWLASEIIF